MKHYKKIVAILALLAILLFLFTFFPEGKKIFSGKDMAASSGEEVQEEVEEQEEDTVGYGFNLKYDRYLVEAPYTYVTNGEERCFQFDVMREKIAILEADMKNYKLTYIDNYKDRNGKAPLYKGMDKDAGGVKAVAAAPAYGSITDLSEFVYLTDGTLVEILEEDVDYTLVGMIGSEQEYSVPSKYVPTDDCLTELKKVIIVDITNQNIATFEKESKWNITSYSLATTGKVGEYHEPTQLGYFYAVEKKPKFFYLKDGTNDIEGYAPYAVRFNGGAYIHGISTPYKVADDGTKLDPGIKEFSDSIGTVPLSHKCVRNYTSHAKFIYDWYEHGKTVVIVIE